MKQKGISLCKTEKNIKVWYLSQMWDTLDSLLIDIKCVCVCMFEKEEKIIFYNIFIGVKLLYNGVLVSAL